MGNNEREGPSPIFQSGELAKSTIADMWILSFIATDQELGLDLALDRTRVVDFRTFRIESVWSESGRNALSNSIKGTVASIGDNGQLITDISIDQVEKAPRDDSVQIKFGGHETLGIYPAEHDQPAATMVATLGKSGFVEIEIVGISLSEMLGIKTEEKVEVVWP